ncbi:MAG: hypothetical protein JWP55_4344 [Mycobacterium sp.]|nr:hypothetical protein [Mycobacterium sp.]
MSSERTVLKQSGMSRVVPIAVWATCVLASGDAIVEGTATFTLHTVMAMAAVALATWIVLFTPNLTVDAEGITINNPVRIVTVPFGALIDVRVGGAATVLARFAGGRERKVTSWNAPGIKRRRPTRRVGGIGGSGAAGMITYSAGRSNPNEFALQAPKPTTPEVEAAVDHFRAPWDHAHPGGDSTAVATTAWRWREWLVFGLLIVVNVAIRLR